MIRVTICALILVLPGNLARASEISAYGIVVAQAGSLGGAVGKDDKSVSGTSEATEGSRGRSEEAAPRGRAHTRREAGASSHPKPTRKESRSAGPPAGAGGEASGVREPCVGIAGALSCVNRALNGPPVVH